jgi:hypothetical protein
VILVHGRGREGVDVRKMKSGTHLTIAAGFESEVAMVEEHGNL